MLIDVCPKHPTFQRRIESRESENKKIKKTCYKQKKKEIIPSKAIYSLAPILYKYIYTGLSDFDVTTALEVLRMGSYARLVNPIIQLVCMRVHHFCLNRLEGRVRGGHLKKEKIVQNINSKLKVEPLHLLKEPSNTVYHQLDRRLRSP